MGKAIQVRRYSGDRAYQADAERWRKNGYEILSVVSEQQRSGCLRIILTGGIGAIAFRPKPKFVVTYQKED